MKLLNPMDAMFLWLETRTQPMHVAGLSLFTPPANAGPHFVAETLAHWRTHTRALPPFNQRPVLRFGVWTWEEDREFELDYHVRHLALPQPGRIRELLAMISRLHGNLTDRNRPLWEAYLIEGLPGGRFAIYLKIHHAMIDGVTGAKMMAQSLALSATENKPPLWAYPFPKRPRQAPVGTGTRLLNLLLDTVRAGREIVPGIGSGLWDVIRSSQATNTSALPLQAPPTPFNVEISGSRRFVAQSYSMERFQRLGEAHGATINDITLAVCAGALRRYLMAHDALPGKPLIAMVPVSLHGETDKGGNQVGLLLANLATHIADPITRLKHIVSSTRAAKARLKKMSRLEKMAHAMSMMVPAGPLIVSGSAREHPLFNVVISNVPGAKDPLFLNGARLDEVYPVSIPTTYLALNITISGYHDTLGFGFTACRRSVPGMQRLVNYTDDALAELEASLPALAKTKRPRRRPASR